jgi:inosine-uridine nucleoside N-ribohydrolase
MPLVNSAREQELREALYGSHATWHGAFNPDTPPPTTVWPPPGGYPKTTARPGHAASFIIETVRAHPNEVVLYLAGPLTNLALAVRMDPEIVSLVKALHIMGASSGGGFELNWWWDPEAAAIIMREPWKEIVVTTGEAGAQVFSSAALMRQIADSKGRLARYVREQYLDYQPGPNTTLWSAMWDEISVAALIDASVIKRSESMYLDVDITHGPKYGHTVVWRKPAGVPSFFLPYSGPSGVDRSKWLGHLDPLPGRTAATVYMEVDALRFERVFVELMSR